MPDDAILDSWMEFEEVSRNTPNYHSIVEDGGDLPVNEYERFDALYLRMQQFWPSRNKVVGISTSVSTCREALQTGAGRTWTGYPENCLYLGDLYNDVHARLNRKVRDNEFNLAFTLAELPDTAKFIASAMTRTARALRSIKRGRVKDAVKHLSGHNRSDGRFRDSRVPDFVDTAADLRLNYSLALRPLVADVANASAYLERSLNREKVLTVRSGKGFTLTCNPETQTTIKHAAMFNAAGRVSGGLRYTISNPVLYTLQNLGFTNPLAVAWEVVPYSFVVDWFVPVNAFIQNLQPPLGVEFHSGWDKVQLAGSVVNTMENTSKEDEKVWVKSTEVWKERRPLSGFPRPRIKVPDLSLSKNEIATGMALLWKAIRR